MLEVIGGSLLVVIALIGFVIAFINRRDSNTTARSARIVKVLLALTVMLSLAAGTYYFLKEAETAGGFDSADHTDLDESESADITNPSVEEVDQVTQENPVAYINKQDGGTKEIDENEVDENVLDRDLQTSSVIKQKINIKYEDVFDSDNNNIYTISGVLDTGTIVWKRTWEAPATELPIASPYSVKDGLLYIVVTGNLYVIEDQTGEIVWEHSNVGYSAHAPVIDDDGTIYTTGYYNPFLTAINPDGSMKWKVLNLNDSNIYWPYNVIVKEDSICVEYEGGDGGTVVMDKSGNILSRDHIAP